MRKLLHILAASLIGIPCLGVVLFVAFLAFTNGTTVGTLFGCAFVSMLTGSFLLLYIDLTKKNERAAE